jgi:hypothetical protein
VSASDPAGIPTFAEYFLELEHATRLLNHPGETLVLQTDFLYMVEPCGHLHRVPQIPRTIAFPRSTPAGPNRPLVTAQL